jgi:hypothetical protein
MSPDYTASLKVYPYRGLPLTPAIMEELILELCSEQLLERQAIVESVYQAHIARGGDVPRVVDLPRSVKKALAGLRDRGLADNPSVGYWRIGTQPRDSRPESPEVVDLIVPDATPRPVIDVPADIVLGTGPSAVYLYYLPVYRQLAEERHESMWLCKIGRTDRDPLTRILAQAATALPERPVIALIIRTAYPVAWESAFYSVLTLRGRHIDGALGAEWFLTSPDEVLALAQCFDPQTTS